MEGHPIDLSFRKRSLILMMQLDADVTDVCDVIYARVMSTLMGNS